MSLFVSPFNPTQQSGVRAKNPPDLVIASRPPTTKDFSYFVGQLWVYLNNAYYGLVGVATGGSPSGQWVSLGAAGGALNTINLVPPVLNNINFVDFFSALNNGAIRVSTPATIPPTAAGTIGLGVKVDGTTIQINGADELEVIALAPTLTLQGDAPSAAQPYLANNFTFQGIPTTGAIVFNSSAPGVMDAAVQVDGNSIVISASNELQRKDFFSGTAVTAIGGNTNITWAQTATANIPLTAGQLYYVRVRVVGRDSSGPATYVVIGGREEAIISTIAAAPSPQIVGADNLYFSENPSGAMSGTKDFNVVLAAGNNLQVNCVGASAVDSNVPMTWYAELELISI